ncbi:MAG: MBL fold metallo-hydrolase [Acidobacteria bacterium]|nr:MBL fold metallo-hydrolase [Acidobacteriota bacterium]
MALVELRRAENVGGDFFVDSTCIDCDLCRQIAPETFARAGEQSAVHGQPTNAEMEFAALKALISCPTSSIGTIARHDTKAAVAAYPESLSENIFFCGFASEASYGASSYFIKREVGNILVDSPRFAKPLARRLHELGGVKLMFLTHRDDVADHEKWAAEFHCERLMHCDDAGRSTQDLERVISGHEAVAFDDEVLLIPTPGHTRGHTVLLYQKRFLFAGDHLWWSPNYQSLHASANVCWYNWNEQTRSMERLLDYEFEWLLPGHGRRFHADKSEMRRHLMECITQMKAHSHYAPWL